VKVGIKVALISMLGCAALASGCVRQVTATYIQVPTTRELAVSVSTTRDLVAVKNKIPPVEGSTTTKPLTFAKGSVVLSGIVKGPDGPVEGAVVILTRIVGDQRAEMRVTTDVNGRYLAPQIKGGVVELFAYKAPSFSAGDGKVVFVSGNMRQDLELQNFSDVEIRWSVGPGQPTLDRPINLSLQLTIRRVDPDGVVRSAPLEGIGARIVPLGLLLPVGDTQKLTDAKGLASFPMICAGLGESTLQVFFASGEETTFKPRACELPPTTSTLPGDTIPVDGASTLAGTIQVNATTVDGLPVVTSRPPNSRRKRRGSSTLAGAVTVPPVAPTAPSATLPPDLVPLPIVPVTG
jgi:hypothetical protein